MQAARDDHIIRLFTELTDEHDRHPRRERVGDAEEAADELGKLAEREPQRAIDLARRLQPVLNEIPAGEIIQGLAKSDIDRAALYALIAELTDKGFSRAPNHPSAGAPRRQRRRRVRKGGAN